MNKVATVNLNGRAYQIEEQGYVALNRYLGQAEKQLGNNPDRDEIIADFEQAVAEKCDQVLTGGKTVVSEAAIKNIIEQMGPVDGDEEADSQTSGNQPTKQLYLIKEGAIIGGVCKGIATYFNIDVTVVRLITLLLAFFTSGVVIVIYVVLMFLIPEARTPEEKAAAQGAHFNSKALLETARHKYEALGDKQHWQTVANQNKPLLNSVGNAIQKLLRICSGIIAAFGVAALLGIAVAGISGVWSLLFSNELFGFVTFDPSVSTSLFTMLIVCGLIAAAVPIFLITIICFRYAKSGTIKQNIWAVVSALVLFAVALGIGIAIFSTMPQLRHATAYHKSATNSEVTHVCLGNCPPDPYPRQIDQTDKAVEPIPAPNQPLPW